MISVSIATEKILSIGIRVETADCVVRLFLEDQESLHYLLCAECGAILFTWITYPR